MVRSTLKSKQWACPYCMVPLRPAPSASASPEQLSLTVPAFSLCLCCDSVETKWKAAAVFVWTIHCLRHAAGNVAFPVNEGLREVMTHNRTSSSLLTRDYWCVLKQHTCLGDVYFLFITYFEVHYSKLVRYIGAYMSVLHYFQWP